eukprot:CAMPEP_0198330700 /NCGR_PEP_ID=MMETSP1450-20131203/17099_1 /TAXON_ID=753684 ORGANISM="Madagascaria erythrocladiodes, Strain CCMP3234" /NCGR_SAMPLE_ID=MMETSP1450 /ASSEMBLY_ACC=CAM_ASM_001115 /LENGTH=456 /DNA_ID=CAMNT_0044035023 /DNA_START=73 /DNA_END=1439 /DNA_ORIENTATION=-
MTMAAAVAVVAAAALGATLGAAQQTYEVPPTPSADDADIGFSVLRIGFMADVEGVFGDDAVFAAQLAVDRLNADASILPEHRVQLAVANSASEKATLRGGLRLITEDHVSGIAATEFSFTTRVMSLAAAVLGVPQVAWGATSPTLSDKTTHTFLARTVPSDAQQARVMAGIVHRYNYERVFLISSTDTYGAGLQRAVERTMLATGVEVARSVTYALGSTVDTLLDSLAGLKADAEARGAPGVFVLVGLANGGAELLIAAHRLGLIGDARRVWILADGLAAYADDLVKRGVDMAWLEGSLGVVPAKAGGATYEREYLPAWTAYRDALRANASALGTAQRSEPFLYAPYAHDAVYAIGRALDDVRRRYPSADLSPRGTNGTTVRDAVRRARFAGATGTVSFLPYTGDRPALYDVTNVRGGAYAKVGSFVATTVDAREDEITSLGPSYMADDGGDGDGG